MYIEKKKTCPETEKPVTIGRCKQLKFYFFLQQKTDADEPLHLTYWSVVKAVVKIRHENCRTRKNTNVNCVFSRGGVANLFKRKLHFLFTVYPTDISWGYNRKTCRFSVVNVETVLHFSSLQFLNNKFLALVVRNVGIDVC